MTTSKNVRSRKSASKPVPTSQVETPATPIDGAETPEINGAEAPLSIAKPAAFSLDRFKTKNLTGIANVGSLLMALPHYPISQAGDFVRLHHDESTFWSDELCFVSVPIKGMAKDVTHLIARDLVEIYLGNMLKRVKTYRLALATKPFDVFALIHVPSQHLDNPWNHDALKSCHEAQQRWVHVNSRKAEGVEGYKVDYAKDPNAFPEPKWPKHTLDELIAVSFEGRMIETPDHPALLRLIGKRQST